MVTAMTIAGLDPSCGAGVAADIKTFCALDVFPVAAVACITSQNDAGYFSSAPVEASVLESQIKAVVEYYKVSAVKVGMLYSRENIKGVAEAIGKYSLKNIVLDPLITSSTGEKLVDDISFLKSELFPHAYLITPNIAEVEALIGRVIANIDDMKEAAAEISLFGCGNVVITGFSDGRHSIDMLYDGGDFTEYKKDLLTTVPDLHGTGCTFSSAAAAFLAKGRPVKEAVKEAKEYTYYAIKYASRLGEEKWSLNHFFMKGSY